MLRPKDLTDQLGISPATLRNWSNQFSAVLSPAAQKVTTEQGTAAQRRYTPSDLAYLKRAKALLNEGKTYEETLTVLQETVPEGTECPTIDETDGQAPTQFTQITPLLDEHPMVVAWKEALAAKDETIKAKEETIASQQQTICVLEARLSDLTPPPATDSVPWWQRLRNVLQGV